MMVIWLSSGSGSRSQTALTLFWLSRCSEREWAKLDTSWLCCKQKEGRGQSPRAASGPLKTRYCLKICWKTNLQNKGLISVDRGTKATLVRTIPRSYLSRIQRICQSRYFKLFSSIACPRFSARAVPLQYYGLSPEAVVTHVTPGTTAHRNFSAWILA